MTISLPPEVREVFDELTKPLGNKDKWMAAVAAILLFVGEDSDVKDYYIRQAGMADLPGGSFADLVAAAKSGKLARDAAAHTGKRLRIAAKRPQPPRAPS